MEDCGNSNYECIITFKYISSTYLINECTLWIGTIPTLKVHTPIHFEVFFFRGYTLQMNESIQ